MKRKLPEPLGVMEPILMPDTALPDSLIDSLIQVLGEENVLTDPYDLDRYSAVHRDDRSADRCGDDHRKV